MKQIKLGRCTITQELCDRLCTDAHGWYYCTHCHDLGDDGLTEPDAEGYFCDLCQHRTRMGLENAVIAGLVDVR